MGQDRRHQRLVEVVVLDQQDPGASHRAPPSLLKVVITIPKVTSPRYTWTVTVQASAGIGPPGKHRSGQPPDPDRRPGQERVLRVHARCRAALRRPERLAG